MHRPSRRISLLVGPHRAASVLLVLTSAASPACSGGAGDSEPATGSTGAASETVTDATTTASATTEDPTTTVVPTTGTSDTGTSDTGTSDTGTTGEPIDPAHEATCQMIHAVMGQHGGFELPGVSGAPRWGLPAAPPAKQRTRRSWSTLSDADKQQVVDAFLALKHTTKESGDPGSPRADYTSFCDVLGLESYARNLYDYYVESHANAFMSMMTPAQPMQQAPHMGPQFLAWHRYLLLRIEADMGEAIGDPEFALPYWDWTDCDEKDPGCADMFRPELLGTAGSCNDDDSNIVSGYMVDNGFLTNIYTSPGGPPPFVPSAIQCGQRPITRKVGCLTAGPPDDAAIAGVFDRLVYDAAPYDSCHTDEDVSFRQYLEGYDNNSTEPICIISGCDMHGQGHFFVGGDMQFSSANPNDPMFFLHHAQVDRVWAAWQAANLASGDPGRTADHGNPAFPADYRGPLFIWNEVEAAELFDYTALGYAYDSLPTP